MVVSINHVGLMDTTSYWLTREMSVDMLVMV